MSTRDIGSLLRTIGTDPIKFGKACWPHVTFYKQQIDIIESVLNNTETYVKAGNMLGKDFVTAFIVIYAFLSRNPCRIVTTSVDSAQLEGVLWGEIRNFIQTSRIPLDSEKGGPLICNHMHLRKQINGNEDGLSYVIGRVAKKGEGLLGHHIAEHGDGIPRTFAIGDEASGLDDEVHTRCTTWARRLLFIGNPYPCENFFKKMSKEGDLKDPTRDGMYYRKVFKIKGEDSPNVRRAQAEREAGLSPSGKIVVPGVLPYPDYVYRRATWDVIRQCVSLDAEFWEGAEILLFPPQWLDKAERRALGLMGQKRVCRAIGIDTAEGGDNTAFVAIDEYGIIEIVSEKTPDTDSICGKAIAFILKHACPHQNVAIDRGGGGKQLADRLRKQGFDVRTVAFGGSVTPAPKFGMKPVSERVDDQEERYAYVNCRAQMYGELSLLLDVGGFGSHEVWYMIQKRFGIPLSELTQGFSIPAREHLRHQMAPIPRWYDGEGRLRLPSKNKKSKDSKEKTLTEMIGHSPDELDALVLAVHAMLHRSTKVIATSS
jgi:hypothetical protein